MISVCVMQLRCDAGELHTNLEGLNTDNRHSATVSQPMVSQRFSS